MTIVLNGHMEPFETGYCPRLALLVCVEAMRAQTISDDLEDD